MELLNNEISLLRKEINRQCDYLSSGGNITDMMYCASSISALYSFYEVFAGRGIKLPGQFDTYFDKSQLLYIKNSNSAIEILMDRKNEIINFLENISQIYRDILDNQNYNDVSAEVFSNRYFNYILRSYFKDTHPNQIKLFFYLINKRTFSNVKFSGDLKAMIVDLYKEKPLLFINNVYTLDSLFALIHEFGHAIELINLKHNFSYNDIINFLFFTGNAEINARYYEKNFLDYCVTHKIETSYAQDTILDFYYNNHFFASMLLDFYKGKEISDNPYTALEYLIGGVVGSIIQSEMTFDISKGQKLYRLFIDNRLNFCFDWLNRQDIVERYERTLIRDRKLLINN